MDFAAASERGPYLLMNEDAYYTFPDLNFYMLFDGLGGNENGKRIVKHLAEIISTTFFHYRSDPDSTMPHFFSSQYLLETNSLVNSVIYANKVLCEENAAKPLHQRGAAAGVILFVGETLASLISVGNCSCLLNRNNEFHSLFFPEAFNESGITANAFGLFNDLKFDLREIRFNSDDLFMLATDGVDRKTLMTADMNNGSLSSIIKKSFDKTNRNGNKDNQSMMILKF